MKVKKFLRIKTFKRQLALSLMLLCALGVAAASWREKQIADRPDPSILFRTETEAIAGAQKFLTAAQLDHSGYDLARPVSIAKERFKGQKVWRITWPRAGEASTNQLVVLVGEYGAFFTSQMAGPNESTLIQAVLIPGVYTNIIRQHSVQTP